MAYLITSESFLKNQTPVCDNVAGKYILSALRDAQEIHIKRVIGSALLERLKALCQSKQIDKETAYKELLEKCQLAIAFHAVAELTRITTYKITNKGVVTTSDERVDVASEEVVISTQDYYRTKASSYVYELQLYLLENASKFPELSDRSCDSIHANLKSAASCGLWLGGVRSKKVW